MKRFQMPESMKVASIWVVWGFLAIGALGSALFVVLDYFEVKNQAAAWVQAIGSIAAVLVATWVANHQSAMTLQFRRDADTEALKKIVAVAKYAGKCADRCHVYVSLGQPSIPNLKKFNEKLADCEYLLVNVNYMQVPLSEVALGWIELRHAIRDMKAWVSDCLIMLCAYNDDTFAELTAAHARAMTAVQRILNSASGLMPELLADDE